MAFHIVINDTKSEIWREYPEGIKFDGPYEVCLRSFVTYNNIFNVTEKNNVWEFVYPEETAPNETEIPFGNPTEEEEVEIHLIGDNEKPKKEKKKRAARKRVDWGTEIPGHYLPYVALTPEEHTMMQLKIGKEFIRETVIIPPGIYEIEDINAYLKPRVPNGKKFWLLLNKNTLRVEMGGTVGVDLSSPQSIGQLLGFERKIYPRQGHYYSTGRVDIFPINMIKITANIVKSNIVDNKRFADTIYEFPLNANPGEKIVERPSVLTFYKVNIDLLHQLHLKIVDQDNRLIDFQGEKISIVLEFRPAS